MARFPIPYPWKNVSVKWKYKGNFYKQSLSQMIENCLIWREKAKVPPPFLNSSLMYLFKVTAMPNLRAVTVYNIVELLWLLILVSKRVRRGGNTCDIKMLTTQSFSHNLCKISSNRRCELNRFILLLNRNMWLDGFN